MGNCTRCQRTTTVPSECQECHETFCEVHRSPRDHDCRVASADGGEGAAGIDDGAGGSGWADGGPGRDDPEPTVLYPEHSGSSDTGESGPSDGSGGGETLSGMDFDPTARIRRLLRTGGVVAVVLVVGLAAGGFLWTGPGSTVLDGPSANSDAATDDLDTTRVERLVHEYVNRERREAGAEPVEYDADLAAISEYHSRDMANQGYVNHTSPDGETIADRYRKFGYACDTNGEIIQWLDYDEIEGTGEEALARAVVENWMSSELHRSFVLNRSWTRRGVGVYLAGSGRVYVTQNACSAPE